MKSLSNVFYYKRQEEIPAFLFAIKLREQEIYGK